MSYEHKNGQGSMFELTERKSDKSPHFNGMIVTPNGEHLQIAGWKKKSQGGKKYLSLSISVPREAKEEKPSSEVNW